MTRSVEVSVDRGGAERQHSKEDNLPPRSHTDIDALRTELARALATAKVEHEMRVEAEKRLAEAYQEIGRLRATLKQDQR